MSYNPNIPIGTDKVLQSQAQIRANFQAINIAFSENHTQLTSNQSQGKHTVLTMRPQTLDPVTDADHVGFYNKLVTSIPELFFAPNNSQTPIQLTYPSINTASNSLTQYSFMAGPFVVYGGKIVGPTNGQTITLIPTSTLIYVGLTGTNIVPASAGTQGVIPINITGSAFDVKFTSFITSLDVYYLAIGV